MSDDLVNRLRELGDHASFEPHMHHTAANHIEQLRKACIEWAEVSQSNYQRAKAAEAKLAKAHLALNYFLLRDPDKPSSWEYTRDRAEQLARTTLAELTGGKDAQSDDV